MFTINVEFVPKIKLMGFVSYKSPWIHFKRNIDEYVLYFIKSGQLHIQENRIPYVLTKGDMLLLEPNLDHEGIEQHVCDYYYIHFKHPDITPLDNEEVLTLEKQFILEDHPLINDFENHNICYFPKYCSLSNKQSLHQVHYFMNDMLQLNKRKQYNRSITALRFSELFIEVSRENFLVELQKSSSANTKSFVKVHALLDYIHHNYSQKITSADIEQEFECNYDYINRMFKKLTGHTITHYINRVRINHAKELIEATHLSFGEIGYLTGLNDPFYFSKVFKKYVGLSPNQYFKRIRDSD